MKQLSKSLRSLKLGLVVASLSITGLAFSGSSVLAAAPSPPPSPCAESATFLKFPTWYKYIIDPSSTGTECKLAFNPLTDTPKVLLAVFEIILRIGGLLAVGMIIYGGIQYILSQGEPDKAKGARSTILNAIIGLVISMSAVVIVNLIGKNI